MRTSLYDKLTLLLIFFITAANSDLKLYYYFFGVRDEDLIHSTHGFLIPLGLAIFIILMKTVARQSDDDLIRTDNSLPFAVWFWFFAATLSAIGTFQTADVVKQYVGGFFSAIIIYTALRNARLTKTQFNRIFLALSLGAVTSMMLGIVAYYREWGIPDFNTLIYSRYDLPRMFRYREMTFGNTGNTAQFLLLIGSPLLALTFDQSRSKRLRIWFGFCFFLTILNLLIVQSRAALLIIILAFLIILYFKRPANFLIILVIVFIFLQLPIPGLDYDMINLLSQRIIPVITVNKDDQAVFGRLETMKEGWDIFLHHLVVGVGPGASSQYIEDKTAHQFFIQQGVELGVFGFLTSILLVMAVLLRFVKIIFKKSRDQIEKDRFILLIGPAMYLIYGIVANVTLNIGIVNIWITMMAAFLALADFQPVIGPKLEYTKE